MVPIPLRSPQEGSEVASLKLPGGIHSGEFEKRWNEIDATDGRGADLPEATVPGMETMKGTRMFAA